MSEKTTYGKIAYDAYCEAVGGKAYNGEPLPSYADIEKKSVVHGWEAAAQAVVMAHIEATQKLADEVEREFPR